MRSAAYAIALAIGLTTPAAAAPLELHRGVGVHDWLNWAPLNPDGTYIWPPYRSEKDWLSGNRPLTDWPSGDQFVRIKAMGFDFVRMSVDPGPLLASEGAKRREALDVLSAAVKRVTSAGLKVVFDLHGVSQVSAYSMKMISDGPDSDGVARYRQMVGEVAGMLAETGADKVAIEPYNEPAYYPCESSGGKAWQRVMADTVRDIRSVSRELTIIATGACGGNVRGLVNLSPDFDDPGIYYSFHMYEPHSFTHQRSERPKGFMSGLPWPAERGSPEAVVKAMKSRMEEQGLEAAEQSAELAEAGPVIAEYFDQNWGQSQLETRFGEAVDWAKANGIPTRRLFMGEFGAILITGDGRSGAPDADRLRYITAVRQLAERFDIPWSIWEYSNPYGMSVIRATGAAVPDRGLLRALGLTGKQ